MSEPPVGELGEIVFGESVPLSSSLSIISKAFPDRRVLHWIPKHARSGEHGREAGSEDVALVISQQVLLGTSRHVSRNLERELGGFLLGNRYRCPSGRNYVIVDQFIEGEETESDAISLHFTHETLRRLDDLLNTTYLGKVLVGWYHSHPRMGVFMSEPDDLSIHERRFPEPWQSALVLEPEKHHGGFFCWRGGRLDIRAPVDFYELLRDDARETVVGWENYSGVDPLRNATPTAAPVNTKTVGGWSDAPMSQPTRTRQRPWALMALAAVACLSAALYFLTGRQEAHSDGAPTPTPAATPQATPTEPAPTPKTKETPRNTKPNEADATPTGVKPSPPAPGPQNNNGRNVGGGGASGGGSAQGGHRGNTSSTKPPPHPPGPRPTPTPKID